MAPVEIERLTYSYPGLVPGLDAVSLRVDGGLTVVAGESGGGKSTLLRLCNGLVPHFHGGRISGRVTIAGQDVLRSTPRHMARHVGFVFQDPELQAVYTTVEREVAFGLENLAVPRALMRDRVEAALAEVGALPLRGRRMAELSGGERQRVALASALVLGGEIVVLDEPTSQLDPAGAALLIDACRALAARGRTVIVAEHRLEELLPAAERVVLATRGGIVAGTPRELAPRLPSPPSVVALGVRLGWSPPPLTLAEARPLAPSLRDAGPPPARGGEVAWELAGAGIGAGADPVLQSVDLTGRAGEVVVLMGPNGGGKTTLLRTLAGLTAPRAGRVERRRGRIAYLPQNPAVLLHRPTVRDEVELTLRRTSEPGDAGAMLRRLGLEGIASRYPRDASGGERQRTAIAAVLVGAPSLVLLDEPTRGMDAAARASLRAAVEDARRDGAACVVATHDSDVAAEIGDRIVLVGDGRVRDLGPPESALAGDGPLATQIGRLYPRGPVTVDGVMARR